MRNSKNWMLYMSCLVLNLISIGILANHYLLQRLNKSPDQKRVLEKPPEFKIQAANYDLVVDGKETTEPSDHMKILGIRMEGEKLILPFLESDEVLAKGGLEQKPVEIKLELLCNGDRVTQVTFKTLSPNQFKVMVIKNSRSFDRYNLTFIPAEYQNYPECRQAAQWKFSLQTSEKAEVSKSYWHNPEHVQGLSEFSKISLLELQDKKIPVRLNYKSQAVILNGKAQLKLKYSPLDEKFLPDTESDQINWQKFCTIPVSDKTGQNVYLAKATTSDLNSLEDKSYLVHFKGRRDLKGNYLTEAGFDLEEKFIGPMVQDGWVRYLPPAWLKAQISFPRTKKTAEGYSIRLGGADVVGLDVDANQQTLLLPLMSIVKNGLSDQLDVFTRNLSGKEYKLEKLWSDSQAQFVRDLFRMIQQRNIRLQKMQGIVTEDTDFHFLQYQYPNQGKQWGYIFYIEPALNIPNFPQTVPAPKQVCLKYFIDPQSGRPTIYPEKEWKVGVYTPTMKEYAVFFDRLTYLETAFGKVLVAAHVEENKITAKFEDDFPQAGIGAFFMTFEMQNNAWTPTLVATDFRPSKDISAPGWKDIEKIDIKIQSRKIWQFHLYKNGELYAKYQPDVNSKDPNRNISRIWD